MFVYALTQFEKSWNIIVKVDAAQVLYDYETVNKAVTNETSYVTIAKKKKKKD